MIPNVIEAVATITQGPEPLLVKLQMFLDWAGSSPRHRYLRVWDEIKAVDLAEDAATLQTWFREGLDSLEETPDFLGINLGDCPEIYSLFACTLESPDKREIIKAAMSRSDLAFYTEELEEAVDWDNMQILADNLVEEFNHEVWEYLAALDPDNTFCDADGAYVLWYGFASICTVEAARSYHLNEPYSDKQLPLVIGFEEGQTLLGSFVDGNFIVAEFEPVDLSSAPSLEITQEQLAAIYAFVREALPLHQSYPEYSMQMSAFAEEHPVYRSRVTDGILTQRGNKDSLPGGRMNESFEQAEQWFFEALKDHRDELEHKRLILNLGWVPEHIEISVITKTADGTLPVPGEIVSVPPESIAEAEASKKIILKRQVRELPDVIWHDYPVPDADYKPMTSMYFVFFGVVVKALHCALLKLREDDKVPQTLAVDAGYGNCLERFLI